MKQNDRQVGMGGILTVFLATVALWGCGGGSTGASNSGLPDGGQVADGAGASAGPSVPPDAASADSPRPADRPAIDTTLGDLVGGGGGPDAMRSGDSPAVVSDATVGDAAASPTPDGPGADRSAQDGAPPTVIGDGGPAATCQGEMPVVVDDPNQRPYVAEEYGFNRPTMSSGNLVAAGVYRLSLASVEVQFSDPRRGMPTGRQLREIVRVTASTGRQKILEIFHSTPAAPVPKQTTYLAMIDNVPTLRLVRLCGDPIAHYENFVGYVPLSAGAPQDVSITGTVAAGTASQERRWHSFFQVNP